MKGFFYLTVAVLVFACKPQQDLEEASAGEADFSRVVFVGGGEMAGLMDDALYAEGIDNSLAAILNKQFESIGSNGFMQAQMDANSAGCSVQGKARFKLDYRTDCLGVTSLGPVRVAAVGDFNALISPNNVGGAYTNFAVPFAPVMAYGLPGYGNPANGTGNFNPFFTRLTTNANASINQVLAASNATFFVSTIGIDEVLTFAAQGFVAADLPPSEGAAGVGFRGSYDLVLQQLTANGAKGALVTIPDVTNLPFFTTIPYNNLVLDAANNASLNGIYNNFGISFNEGPNPFMMEDPGANSINARKMEPGEKLLISVPLDSVKCHQMGSIFPLRDEFVLSNQEQFDIRARIQQYNAVIRQLAEQYNLAVVESEGFFGSFTSGIAFNGVNLSTTFVSGGVYSLDGRMLTPRGNALFANEIIKAINTKYKSSIWLADATKYRGVLFP